jgi:hypothetical protein
LTGFLTHFDDLIGHWHGLTEWFVRSYALPRLRIKRPNGLLRREPNMMPGYRRLLVLQDILIRTQMKTGASWKSSRLVSWEWQALHRMVGVASRGTFAGGLWARRGAGSLCFTEEPLETMKSFLFSCVRCWGTLKWP